MHLDDEPIEGDLITEDFNHFTHLGGDTRSMPGLNASDCADWRSQVTSYFERIQYWPNVWSISDHGNVELITDLYGEAA